MTILVTGAAGFIGSHVCHALLNRGEQVVGVDNLNDYYDPALKQARLARLTVREGFSFHKIDIADREAMHDMVANEPGIDRVIHLAAQAGVRYSLSNPYAYTQSNVEGTLVVLELVRGLMDRGFKHLVYASTSSVYGANKKLPFSVDDRVDSPISLYAATKKCCELMAHTYAHLFRVPATGLRFFTVYGPWGRPDMAAYIFTSKILAGEPIPVFNHGKMERDFTYVDDIVAGVLGALDNPPADDGETPPYALYNIGNNNSEPLTRFISILEEALGRKAKIDYQPMQPGDVPATYADIEATRRDFGFEPSTPIEVGLPRFVEWYKEYHGRA